MSNKVKKTKKSILMWIVAGLATNACLASFITSCGRHTPTSEEWYVPSETDSEYGFNMATYEKLEENFRDQLVEKIKKDDKFPSSIDEKGQQEYIENDDVYVYATDKLNRLHNTLFPDIVTNYGPACAMQNVSFQLKTDSLMNFARNDYDIELARQSTIIWADFEDTRDAYYSILKQQLENSQVDQSAIEERLSIYSSETRRWIDLKRNSSIGANVDMVALFDEFKEYIIMTFCSDNNEYCQKVVAAKLLQNFFDGNEIKLKDKASLITNGLTFDLIHDNPFYKDDNFVDIVHENKVFYIQRKDTKEIQNFNKGTDLIPGYEIRPRFAQDEQAISDVLSNHYNIKIDWEIWKIDQLNAPIVLKNVPSHKVFSYRDLMKTKTINQAKSFLGIDDDSFYINDDQISADEEPIDVDAVDNDTTYNYDWPVSYNEELKQINNNYFANDKIKFSWDDLKSACAREALRVKDPETNKLLYEFDADAKLLGKAGLKINDLRIDQCLSQIEQESQDVQDEGAAKQDDIPNAANIDNIDDIVPAEGKGSGEIIPDEGGEPVAADSIEISFLKNCDLFAHVVITNEGEGKEKTETITCEFRAQYKFSYGSEENLGCLKTDDDVNRIFYYGDKLVAKNMLVSPGYFQNAQKAYISATTTSIQAVSKELDYIVQVLDVNIWIDGIQVALALGTSILALIKFVWSGSTDLAAVVIAILSTISFIAALVTLAIYANVQETIKILKQKQEKFNKMCDDVGYTFIKRLKTDKNAFDSQEIFTQKLNEKDEEFDAGKSDVDGEEYYVDYYSDLAHNPDWIVYQKAANDYDAGSEALSKVFCGNQEDIEKVKTIYGGVSLALSILTGALSVLFTVWATIKNPAYKTWGETTKAVFKELITWKFAVAIIVGAIFKFGVPFILDLIFKDQLSKIDEMSKKINPDQKD